jgi:hypothetical protein
VEAQPVEVRAGIGLAARRDVAVADDARRRDGGIGPHQRARHDRQAPVLARLERPVVAALEFDADREIVAAAAALERRLARVPGAPVEGHVLSRVTAAEDAQVRRHPELAELAEVRVRRRVERVGEQRVDEAAAEAPGRQGDRVHHQQADVGAIGPRVEIRRGEPAGAPQPVRGAVHGMAGPGRRRHARLCRGARCH